ncbi:MAG: metal ABC transporter ATP-binding protein [Turicibacter sanguinis]|uniref:metal ABC transporter ATP-binding protein n=1 Tax=Turicibacter sanguinis TaxID=154288 RepID=UPI0039949BF5
MELLHVEGVSFSYDQYTVIKNLSFKVHEGDYVWVIGENGTGKSTLIKGLLNLKKPSSGQIIFNETLKQSEVGYLPQQTVIQKEFPASVWEIILSGCLNQCGWLPLYKKSDKERAVKWMKELGIYELRDCCYRELSGGQQQRVLLARALCATKKLLILDEPVANLDPKATQDFYRLMHRINQENKIAIVMVSHDIENEIEHATQVVHLKKGEF